MEQLYNFSNFNPIITQIFYSLYHCDHNVLLTTTSASDRILAAEISLFRVMLQKPGSKVCNYTVFVGNIETKVSCVLTTRKESDTYLATFSKLRWSLQITIKVDKMCSFQPALWPSSPEEEDWWRLQCWLKATHFIHFHCDLRDSSDVYWQ